MSQSQSRLVGKASPIDLKGAVVMIAYAIGVGANEGYKKAKKVCKASSSHSRIPILRAGKRKAKGEESIEKW